MTTQPRNSGQIVDGQPCSDDQRSPLPKAPVVGMAYVPFQQFRATNLYSAEKGLEQGTLFPDLDKPFTGWPGDWK